MAQGAQPVGPASGLDDRNTLSVNFTGGLFGYYRIDPFGRMANLSVVSKFNEGRTNQTLLLGMGDNFAPEFGASLQDEGEDPHDSCWLPAKARDKKLFVAPEPLYKDEDRFSPKAECDNVARFLMNAGYRAIVPGREDFIYSSTWLRRIAVLLRDSNKLPPVQDPPRAGPPRRLLSASADGRLHMLGANLRLSFVAEGPDLPPDTQAGLRKQAKQFCPLLFHDDLLSATAPACASSGVTTATDWIGRLTYLLRLPSAPPTPAEAGILRNASADATFRLQLLVNQAKMIGTVLEDPKIEAGMENDIKAKMPTNSVTSFEAVFKELRDAVSCLGDDKNFKVDPAKGISGQTVRYAPVLKCKPEAGKVTAAPDVLNTSVDKISHLHPCSTVDLCTVMASFVECLKRLEPSPQPPLLNAFPVRQSDEDFLISLEARHAEARLLLRTIADEQEDVGYTIALDPTTKVRTLIVGVVGKETMSAVSPTNLKVCTKRVEGNATLMNADFSPCVSDDPQQKSLEHSPGYGRLVGSVVVGDPRVAVSTIVRAVWEREGPIRTIVLAQMPHTEAEELGAHVHADLRHAWESRSGMPWIDLIISEAQADHATATSTMHYRGDGAIPVVTPRPAYDGESGSLVKPISLVKLVNPPSMSHLDDVASTLHEISISRCGSFAGLEDACVLKTDGDEKANTTTADLLQKQLRLSGLTASVQPDLTKWWDACNKDGPCQESATTQYLLQLLRRSANADIVLLERRDLFLGQLPKEYQGYEMCDAWLNEHKIQPVDEANRLKRYCLMRVALDRVLWKGDMSERVMVDGNSLRAMLTTAQAQAAGQQTLAAQDIRQSWLVTFGITGSENKNLVSQALGAESFSVTGDPTCTDPNGQKTGRSPYCVEGKVIGDDGSYWVASSDHLANDSTIYTALSALKTPGYHEPKDGLYLTGEIADLIDRHGQKQAAEDGRGESANTVEQSMANIQLRQQRKFTVQTDFAKVAAGFSAIRPDQPDTTLGTDFSGVSETRAQQPKKQDLDLEAMARVTAGPVRRLFTFGGQTDTEYERSFVGTLTDQSDTVTYGLNSFTGGGFLQFRVDGGKRFDGLGARTATRTLPRWLAVIAPYQYQRQLHGNPLAYTNSAKQALPVVIAPIATNVLQRIGVRYEDGGGNWHHADPGSYMEAGPEYAALNNVLSGLIVPGGTDCLASPSLTLSACVKGQTIAQSTVVVPTVKTLKAGAFYWDFHLVKALDKAKHFSATIDTKGEDYFLPGTTLPTQTRYAFAATGSLNIAVVGNLALSPTYSTFFYKNQGVTGQANSLRVDTFTITAKWFFARDSGVSFWRQLFFLGPATTDLTKTAKIK
jgi:hypothetical protein